MGAFNNGDACTAIGKNAGKSAAPWEARAVEVAAARMPKSRGGQLLESVWEKDQYMSHLSKDALERMQRFFAFLRHSVAGKMPGA